MSASADEGSEEPELRVWCQDELSHSSQLEEAETDIVEVPTASSRSLMRLTSSQKAALAGLVIVLWPYLRKVLGVIFRYTFIATGYLLIAWLDFIGLMLGGFY